MLRRFTSESNESFHRPSGFLRLFHGPSDNVVRREIDPVFSLSLERERAARTGNHAHPAADAALWIHFVVIAHRVNRAHRASLVGAQAAGDTVLKEKASIKGFPPMEASYRNFPNLPLHFPVHIGWGLSWDINSIFYCNLLWE